VHAIKAIKPRIVYPFLPLVESAIVLDSGREHEPAKRAWSLYNTVIAFRQEKASLPN
jgi:hypothetical protein